MHGLNSGDTNEQAQAMSNADKVLERINKHSKTSDHTGIQSVHCSHWQFCFMFHTFISISVNVLRKACTCTTNFICL